MLKLKNSKLVDQLIILVGITLLLLSIMLLPGCKREDPEIENTSTNEDTIESSTGNLISTFKEVPNPDAMPYLVNNNINTTQDYQDNDNLYSFSGLLDKHIEKKINDEITRRHLSLKYSGVPPYRGIKRSIIEDEIIGMPSISTYESFSAYNLLSLNISSYREYRNLKSNENPTVETYSVDCYTVDLNTGKELKLRDLFADNVDYKALIDSYIQSSVNESSNFDDQYTFATQLVQIYPFDGIKEDQKFLLSPYDLQIIIDYDNPEFDTGFSFHMVTIPFKELEGYLAIKERFYDDIPNLYETFEPTYSLIPYISNDSSAHREQKSYENVQVYYFHVYPNNISPTWEKLFLDKTALDEENIRKLQQENSNEIFYTQDFYAQVVGPFFSILEDSMIQHGDKTEFISKETIYDSDGNQLEIGDLFVEGFYFEEIINANIVRALNENRGTSEINFNQIKSTLTFGIGSDSISFTSEPLEFSAHEIHPLTFFIAYKDIGFENLSFFEITH